MQNYVPEARALRGDGMKRTCPTWHGGVAHQPVGVQSGQEDRLWRRRRGLLHAERRHGRVQVGRTAASTRQKSEKRTYTSDLYYGAITAFDTVNHKVLAKAVTDIEIRSGAMVTAGRRRVHRAAGRLGRRLSTTKRCEELWRFNVGTPLKGAPVTYAIGPKQYLAVQTSGRHLHPVKYDKLENSSYLFVFALN